MKKLIVIASLFGLFSTNSHALIQGKNYDNVPEVTMTLFITFSLPTLIVGGEEVALDSEQGKAILVQEAVNVLAGKKSLILVDSPEMSAVEKAQLILNAQE